jgi:hypothetical protein
MRVILIIALLLQVSAASGQADNRKVITVDEALKLADLNNPISLSDSGRKKLSSDIKSAWYLLLFKINKWQTLQYYQSLLGDLDRISALHYQTGDVDLLEKSASVGKLAEVQTATAISANEINITENMLKQLLFIDDEIIPADTTLSLYQIEKGLDYKQHLNNQPEPIAQEDTLLTRYNTFLTAKTIENKQLELDGLFIRLQFYYVFGLPHAEIVLQVSWIKFETEEIDYLEFTEKITEAFKIKLGYLETLNNYNQSAIYLEYYAY